MMNQTNQTFYHSTTIVQQATKKIRESSLCEQNELIQRALNCLENRYKNHSQALTSPQEVCDYLRLLLVQEPNELFVALFLDNKHRVIALEKLFFGTINAAWVHPRVVMQRALANNAAAVIFAHNHPSGSVKPSEGDRDITGQLKTVLEIIDVRVLDHFIVSAEGVYSFAECGLL